MTGRKDKVPVIGRVRQYVVVKSLQVFDRRLLNGAGTLITARYRLAELINALTAPHGFTVAAGDIVIFHFDTATAGDAVKPKGVNGLLEFRVSPSDVSPSAYSDGVITATPYDATANDVIDAPFKVWTHNSNLYATGLTEGEMISVYNMTGQRIYNAIATSGEVVIPLPAKGVYIIIHNSQTIKTVN